MKVIEDLIKIMQSLRDKESGCPWDIEQTHESIAKCTIEEAYEVFDAIKNGGVNDLKEELGDLLLQVIFHSQIASENGNFSFEDVVKGLCDKLVKRHPHVFAGESVESAKQQELEWEAQKEQERRNRAIMRGDFPSILDEIAVGLPSLMRAEKIQKRAAKKGFDWEDYSQVLDKIEEELEELEDSIDLEESQARIGEELGDLLFSIVNLSRHLDIDAEISLLNANNKFINRFRQMEKAASEANFDMMNLSKDELEELWIAIKSKESD